MNRKHFIKYIPIALILIAAIAIRWNNNFSTFLSPGINGGYYPFQVLSILENGKLGFPDLPLVFYIEALFAKIIHAFSSIQIENAVLISTKLIDTIIPPLLIIPIFIFLLNIFGHSIYRKKVYVYVLSSFSVLYLPFILFLAGDFHKNSIGLIWLSLCLFHVFRYINNTYKRHLLYALIFYSLCFLTHIGTFGALIAFSIVFSLILLLSDFKQVTAKKQQIIIVLGVLILSILLLLLFDVKRFDRLVNFLTSPLTLFENPVLLFLLEGQAVYTGISMVNLFACNILAILGIIYILIRRNRFDRIERKFIISIGLTTLFLTSPLIGIEWFDRFLWIAPVFIIIEYAFIFRTMKKRLGLIPLASFIVLITIYSLRPAMMGKKPHITQESYQELYDIKNAVSFGPNSIVLTRHGLEWWAGYALKAKVGQDYSLTQGEYHKYDSVYVLVQHKGNNKKMVAWSHFLEVNVPETAIEKYSGEHFKLYRLTDPLNYTADISSPPITYGEILDIIDNKLIISNQLYRYSLSTDDKTAIVLKDRKKKLQKGMNIEVWGKRSPFSLNINARTIHEID